MLSIVLESPFSSFTSANKVFLFLVIFSNLILAKTLPFSVFNKFNFSMEGSMALNARMK